MPELRQNFFTKEWVIIATERAKRPEELVTHRPIQSVPAFVETCPFCPGSESKTPGDAAVSGEGRPLAVRVIPNKFCSGERCAAQSKLTNLRGVEVDPVRVVHDSIDGDSISPPRKISK